MGLKSKQLWPESKRRIFLFWWSIFVSGQHVRFCGGRKTSKWKQMVSLESLGPSQNYNFSWGLNWLTWSRKNSMHAVCALHHISTSGLLALGYIVMYIINYIYMYVYIYRYRMCMYIHDFACIYIYTTLYIQLCTVYIYMHLYIYLCIYIHTYIDIPI